MATFRDENGKLLTGEELKQMMESARPLTDEELEQANGGFQIGMGDWPNLCTNCHGDNFEVHEAKVHNEILRLWVTCKKCGTANFIEVV